MKTKPRPIREPDPNQVAKSVLDRALENLSKEGEAVKNPKQTSAKVGSKAAKELRDPSSTPAQKSVSGSALGQVEYHDAFKKGLNAGKNRSR